MFNEATKELLLTPERWKLVSSFLPIEAEEIPGSKVPGLDQKQINSHFHREILIPLAGEYIYSFNGKYYSCEPGTIFLIDSEDEHELFYTREPSELTHLWLHIQNNKILGNYMKVQRAHIDFISRMKVEYFDLPPDININTSWDQLKNCPDSGDSLLLHRKFLLALSWLLIKIIEKSKLPQSNTGEYQQEVVEAAKMHIKKSFKRGISSDQLARIAGYSKFHFLRLFKQYTGLTMYEYINSLRMLEFEKLSRENISRKEIATELGFTSPAAFYNWLSKRKKK
jgi:AraC-like DNA-binding protein/quercetin dioxygenase-like cupin family protein